MRCWYVRSPSVGGLHSRPSKAAWQGQRGIDKTVWDTALAQHGKRPRQKGRCEEVLSPVAAPDPWRPAIANAGLIASFLWDILWDIPKNRVPKPMSAQAIGLIVFHTPSKPTTSKAISRPFPIKMSGWPLKRSEQARPIRRPFGVLNFFILSATRSGEARLMTWNEVDLNRRT